MMNFSALAGLLAIAAASPQPGPVGAVPTIADRANAAAPFWAFRDDRLTHVPTGVSFPGVIADETFTKIGIASHHGTGLDDVLEWQTPGRESYISVFVFRPSLADAGLSAAMTDAVIHSEYGPKTQAYDDRVVPVGGSPSVARRIFYQNSVIDGRPMWTGAAVMKVGAWLIVVRISGPANKRPTLEATMSELLADLRFSPNTPPHPFHAIEFNDCPSPGDHPDARLVSVDSSQVAAVVALLAAVDSGVVDQTGGQNKRSDLTRVPDHLCRTTINTEQSPRIELWPPDGNAGGFSITKIAGLVLLDDAGGMVEVVRAGNAKRPFFVVNHAIGEGNVVAAVDIPLSRSQYRSLIDGRSTLLSPSPAHYRVDASGQVTADMPSDRPRP